MSEKILRMLRIQESEFALVRRLFLLHFLIIASFTLGKSARDGLFLGQISVRSLPVVYLGMAAWTVVAVWLFGRIARGVASSRALAGTLVIAAGALVVFYLGFLHWARGTAVLFYLWSGAAGLLLVSQFWTVVNDRTNSRQARRVFGTIGAGGIAGGLAGGAAASVLAGVVGPEPLLLLTALLHLAAVPVALNAGGARDSRRLKDLIPGRDSGDKSAGAGAAEVDESPRDIFRRPYVRQIALLFLVAGMASAILDYEFKMTVQNSITGSGRMTAFLGSFYGVQNLIAIFVQLGLTSLLLTRFGARAASMALPAGLAAAAVFLFGAPGFAAVAGARLFESTLRVSLAGSAWEFLYFPLPDNVRRQARRIIEMIVNRNAEAAAGLLIIATNVVFGGSLLNVTILFTAVVAAWLGLEWMMNRAYVRELSSSLRRMVVDVDATASGLTTETQVSSEVETLLESPYERQVLYAVDLLARLNRPRLNERVPRLLRHPSAAVRTQAIRLAMEQPEIVDLLDMEALLHDADSEVAVNAALFFCRLRPGSPLENMCELLGSDDPVLRSIAFQVVAEHSPPSEDTAVEAVARELAAIALPSDRAAIASAAGRRPAPTRLHHWIPKLLGDPNLAVRVAAIKSAGQAARREYIPVLIERLTERTDRDAARSALAAFGERVTGTLGDYLVDPTVRVQVKRELPRVLAQIGTQEAADNLLRASIREDLALGFQVLRALNRIRNSNPHVVMPPAAISSQIRDEAGHLTRLLVRGRTFAGTPPSAARELLLTAMAEKRTAALDRLFRRIALIYPPHDVRLAYVGLTRDNPRVRAQSVEYIESVLAPEDRRVVLPLIDAVPDDERIDRAGAAFELTSLPVDESVRDIASLNDSWLTACALYLAGTLGLTTLADLVRDSLDDPEILVRDTADWASARLGVA